MKKRVDMNHIFSLLENTPEKGNLFLGGVSAINDIEFIKEKQIDCVLTILDDWAYPKFKVKEILENAKISVCRRIKLEDDEAE